MILVIPKPHLNTGLAMKAKVLTNEKFGKLTVTGPTPTKGFWYTDCDCGTKNHIARGTSLSSGNTKSCGCLRRENKGRPKSKHTHAFIPFNDMLAGTVEHLTPIRNFLKTQGVTVTKDSMLYIDGKKSGPFKSPFHALAHAINKCVQGIEE